MNQNQSTDTSSSSGGRGSAEAISRRAYELWEKDGRPDGNDLRHWLQAEQELRGSAAGSTSQRNGNDGVTGRYTDTPQTRAPAATKPAAAPARDKPTVGVSSTAKAPDTARRRN